METCSRLGPIPSRIPDRKIRLAVLCISLCQLMMADPIVLKETDVNPVLNFMAKPGTVLLCEGATDTNGVVEFCVDENGNLETPSDSVTFTPIMGGMTMVLFCSDSDPDSDKVDGDVGDNCPPATFGQAAVPFESPFLPNIGESTDYTAETMDMPGYDIGNGQAVDYDLISDTAVPEPSALSMIMIVLVMVLASSRNRHRRVPQGRRDDFINRLWYDFSTPGDQNANPG